MTDFITPALQCRGSNTDKFWRLKKRPILHDCQRCTIFEILFCDIIEARKRREENKELLFCSKSLYSYEIYTFINSVENYPRRTNFYAQLKFFWSKNVKTNKNYDNKSKKNQTRTRSLSTIKMFF